MWSNQKNTSGNHGTFDLNKDQNLSFWMYLSPWTTDTNANDGLAFILQSGGTAATNYKSTGGSTIGVWGTSKSNLAGSALKNSAVIEFDTYQNRDGFDRDQLNTTVVDTMGSGFPNQDSTYKSDGSLNMYGTVNIPKTTPLTGQWRHVTLRYVHDSNAKNRGTLYYTYNDRDWPMSTINGTGASDEKQINISADDFGGSSVLNYGFSSASKAGSNYVIMARDDVTKKITSSVTLHDDTSGEDITSDKQVIHGGDKLTYTYKFSNDGGLYQKALSAGKLRAVFPANFTPDSVTNGTTTTNQLSNAQLQTDASGNSVRVFGAAISTITSGQSTTIKYTGTAKQVDTTTTLGESNSLGYNDGLDEVLKTNNPILEPGILSSVTASAKNLSDYGSTSLASAKTLDGDKLEYTFKLTYKHDSLLPWNDGIKADFDFPDQFKAEKMTASYGDGHSDDYTSDQIKAGITLPSGFAINPADQTVTFTVDGSVDGSGTAGAATANFSSPKHSDSGTTDGFKISPIPTTEDISLMLGTLQSGFQTDTKMLATTQTGKHINVPGIVSEGDNKTKNSEITMGITVTHPDGSKVNRHVQLTDSGMEAGFFNMMFVNPISKVDTDSKTVQSVDTESSPLLQKGINTVTLQAYDLSTNKLSNKVTATIDVGGELKFDSGNSTAVNFKNTTLTGRTQFVGVADEPTIKVINTKQTTWQVYAELDELDGYKSSSSDQQLNPQLYYYDGTPGNWWEMSTHNQSAIVGSSSSSDDTEIDIAKNWKSAGVSADSQADVEKNYGPGLYMEIGQDATASVDGTTYTGTIGWTLIDSME